MALLDPTGNIIWLLMTRAWLPSIELEEKICTDAWTA